MHQLLVQGECIVDGGDVLEVDRVGDLQALHPISVSPLLEVHLEGTSSPVAIVPANLAFVFDPQPVQFIEPVGNGLAVPTERQVLGIIDRGI